ncbi:MAG: hypothetical protein GTN73_09685 [Candidatus Aminicenantes bacterium]|nr:hypothetical protein [Candidatus Aminicenantes bacterium]
MFYKKDKKPEDRRKYRRYKCLLPAEVLKAEGKDKFVERASIHDFSCGGSKLIINFITLDPGSDMNLRVYVPEKELRTSLKSEIVWRKFSGEKLEIGLKIKDMEEETKGEIIDWLAPAWSEKKNK